MDPSQFSSGHSEEPVYYAHYVQLEQGRARSWSDGSFTQPTFSPSLSSPIESQFHDHTLISQVASPEGNTNNLSQEIHGFLNSHFPRSDDRPWTGHSNSFSQENPWPQSIPGHAGPMSEGHFPGDNFGIAYGQTYSDSTYQSFEPAGSPLENHAHGQFLGGPGQTFNMSRPPPAESVMSDPTNNNGGYRGPHTRTANRNSRNRVPVPPCMICGKHIKNPSDAVKHHMTHTKPHRCEVPTCSRNEGFATQNDLQRHRKAVHKLKPTVGKAFEYICAACPIVSNTEPKSWPRRDNFKAHINRKHHNWNEAHLIDRSEELGRAKDAMTESGYASAPSQSQIDPFDHTLPMDIDFLGQNSQQSDYSSFGTGDELAGVGAGTSTDPSLGRPELHVSDWSHGPAPMATNFIPVSGMPEQTGFSDMMTNAHEGQNPLIGQLTATLDSNLESVQGEEWNLPNSDSSMQANSGAEASLSNSRHPDGDFICPECPKRMKRECDLRKHFKRHTKPYGCTFPDCLKRFGSRNDWKRHENSQHILAERYRCTFLDQNGQPCAKICSTRAEFIAHMRDAEHPVLTENLDAVAEQMCLGRYGHKRFWCGFCKEAIPALAENQRAWDYRLQHIGDHFDKNGFTIDMWWCSKDNMLKRDIKQAESERNGRATGAGDEEVDDDSDLGDDGIPEPSYVLSTGRQKLNDVNGLDARDVRALKAEEMDMMV